MPEQVGMTVVLFQTEVTPDVSRVILYVMIVQHEKFLRRRLKLAMRTAHVIRVTYLKMFLEQIRRRDFDIAQRTLTRAQTG